MTRSYFSSQASCSERIASSSSQSCVNSADETTAPEPRRQVVHAEDRDAALLLARALATVGAVRAGKQRVKVLPIEDRDPSDPYRWT